MLAGALGRGYLATPGGCLARSRLADRGALPRTPPARPRRGPCRRLRSGQRVLPPPAARPTISRGHSAR